MWVIPSLPPELIYELFNWFLMHPRSHSPPRTEDSALPERGDIAKLFAEDAHGSREEEVIISNYHNKNTTATVHLIINGNFVLLQSKFLQEKITTFPAIPISAGSVPPPPLKGILHIALVSWSPFFLFGHCVTQCVIESWVYGSCFPPPSHFRATVA